MPTAEFSHLHDTLSQHYGLTGELRGLYGFQDETLQLRTADSDTFIVKRMHAGCDPASIDLQTRILNELQQSTNALTPAVRQSLQGKNFVTATDEHDAPRLHWLLNFMPGRLAAKVQPHSAQVLRALGKEIATLAIALSKFDHPHLRAPSRWKLVEADWIKDELETVRAQHPHLHDWLELSLAQYDAIKPVLQQLPDQAIHGDLNDHNVLFGDSSISGIIDFGDAHLAPAICDLAVALAYFMMDKPNPFTAAAEIIQGYHAVRPLNDLEIDVLFPLIHLRLAQSLTHSALNRLRAEEDANLDRDYLLLSEKPALRLIAQLAKQPRQFGERFVQVCCNDPRVEERESRLASSIRSAQPAKLLNTDLSNVPVLDLSPASGSPANPFSGDMPDPLNRNAQFSFVNKAEVTNDSAAPNAIAGDSDAQSHSVVLGRYGEPRMVYQATAFKDGDHPIDDARTIHAGVDVFARAGTPVYAPLAGRVHAIENRTARQDYGPTIVLQHVLDGQTFYTLYGHLSAECLERLAQGDEVEQGDLLCHIGAPPENGDWPPHLHFQWVLDDFNWGTDVPGVSYAWAWPAWKTVFPNPAPWLNVDAGDIAFSSSTTDELIDRRQALLGPNLSLAYARPLHIVRGWMQYLFDADGRCYLDAYNNVPHVGHAHPRVVNAVAKQLACLNTNTRYLHETILEYAERLTAHFPDPLTVCYFVNSASEANELALRLARSFTKAQDMIVMEGAYHGHTSTLIDISPYKAEGHGGNGCPDWVHQVPLVDLYRGKFRYGDSNAASGYAADVDTVISQLQEQNRSLCGYICESLPSVGGQLVYPPGYLERVFHSVRSAGGVCIADEVQTGFGRTGEYFWGFEQQQVTPDIVVLGKPMGNGQPLGAVITRPDIAAAFDTGMEFFSTFGGNPVSCAAGLETLRVVEEDKVQAHSHNVGTHLMAGLRAATSNHPKIGDIRGMGLFLGIEIVQSAGDHSPDKASANWIKNRLREEGILIGTDGIHDNVLKIRPPSPFNRTDADRLVQSLSMILNETALSG